MPSQTFLVRAHARTIHTHPVTFVCAECHTTSPVKVKLINAESYTQ